MKNFVIIANSLKEGSHSASMTVKRVLEKYGCKCTGILLSDEVNTKGGYLYTDPELVSKDTEAVLSIGGDGTFIHASKDLMKLNLPVFGINFGTLGYLTEVDVNGFEDALKSIVAGDFEIEERILIQCEVIKKGVVTHKRMALNDIVINRSLETGIAELDLIVDGHFLNSYSADGIIVSTPTGSTGYNLSAGGPVVLPTAQTLLVTPICAHTLNSRSVVIPADLQVEITCKSGSREKRKKNFVTVDGEQGISLEDGDTVRTSLAEGSAKIIKVNKTSFIENLGRKMR